MYKNVQQRFFSIQETEARAVQEDWMGTQSISQLLFIGFTPEFLHWCRKDKSWSRHQNLQEDWMGTQSDQPESMLIKSIRRYSSTWCRREKSWSRHQNCKRIG